MNVLQKLVKGNGDTWIGTFFFSFIFGLLGIGFTTIISEHTTSCYYPVTLAGSNAYPYIIKGDVDWAEDHTAYRFDSVKERSEALESLVQCASK